MSGSSRTQRSLRLLRESRIADLLPAGAPDRLEASGVVAVDGRFLVIFDNLRSVAIIEADLDKIADNVLSPPDPHDRQGYEDIARDPVTGHLYLLVEAVRRDGGFMARVEEYDQGLRLLSGDWLEFPLPSANKGIEGLECVRRADTTYLLGLCESNRAGGGAAGHQPGGGRIAVFRRGRRNWKHHATIELPATLGFTDYSALSIADGRVAVVSQESSALWSGRLSPAAWEISGPGRTYLFPRDTNGEILYGTAEGVCWLGPDRVVVVSDRVKENTRQGRRKHQSLHLFTLPDAPGEPA